MQEILLIDSGKNISGFGFAADNNWLFVTTGKNSKRKEVFERMLE